MLLFSVIGAWVGAVGMLTIASMIARASRVQWLHRTLLLLSALLLAPVALLTKGLWGSRSVLDASCLPLDEQRAFVRRLEGGEDQTAVVGELKQRIQDVLQEAGK